MIREFLGKVRERLISNGFEVEDDGQFQASENGQEGHFTMKKRIMIREFLGKLRERLLLFGESGDQNDIFEDEEEKDEDVKYHQAPEDVQEGHFAVMATKGLERKRFLVKIEYVNSPEFLRLLEQAEQEYGFEQTGALLIPCTPQELQNILNNNNNSSSGYGVRGHSRRRSLDIRVNQLKQFLKQRFPNLRLDEESYENGTTGCDSR